MKTMRIISLATVAVFTLLTLCQAQNASADSQARLATAQERVFYCKVVGAAHKALPSPPPGWEVTHNTDLDAPEYVSEGIEGHPYSITYDVKWLNVPAYEKMEKQRGRLLEQAADAMSADSSDEALMKRIEELAMKAGQAAERGDFAAAQQIQQQMEPLAGQLSARIDGKNNGVDQVLAQTAVEDIGAEILVHYNSFNFALPDGIKTLPPMDCSRLVFRAPGEDKYTGELSEHGVTTVLLGKGWRKVHDGEVEYVESPEYAGHPYTTVHTIMVEVQAAEDRAAQIIKAIDWNYLEALLAE